MFTAYVNDSVFIIAMASKLRCFTLVLLNPSQKGLELARFHQTRAQKHLMSLSGPTTIYKNQPLITAVSIICLLRTGIDQLYSELTRWEIVSEKME